MGIREVLDPLRVMSESSDELVRGIQVEQEHEATYEWLSRFVEQEGVMPSLGAFAKSIAKDHVREKPDYYSRLDKAGL
jgi:hypothetical protein